MSAMLDDMDSRAGSTTSLLRTVVGLYLRRLGGWMSVADLIELMGQLGVSAPHTRTAVVRLKKKDLLVSTTVDGVVGYRLSAGAADMLERGDRRIFAARTMQPGDPWCLVSFSVPEELRHLRHQLRRRLSWIGCGLVSAGLWICPDFLRGEVEDILHDLGLREHATVFRTERPIVAGELRDSVATWWDLEALAGLHREFLAGLTALNTSDAGNGTAPGAFANYVRLIDSWRVIPYVDPGLAADVLPADWPGAESTVRFDALSTRYADAAWNYVASVAAGRSRLDTEAG